MSSYSGRPGLSSSKYVALNSNSACSFPLGMEPLSRDFQIIENWYSAGSQQRKEGLYPVPRSVWAHLQIRFKGRDTSSWPDVTQQALDQRGVRAALTLYLLPPVLLGRPQVGAGSLMQLVLWPAGTCHHLVLPPSSPVEEGITHSRFLGHQPGSLAASRHPGMGNQAAAQIL